MQLEVCDITILTVGTTPADIRASGIDEGLISGTLAKPNFQKRLGLDKLDEAEFANVEGNISAMVQIGSVAGAGL